MFSCQDIREGQSQKTVAYMQALQYWVEKANLLMPGQPCFLPRYVLKLRKVMEPYMSFSNDAILDGAAPKEGSLMDPTEVTIPRDAPLVSTGTFTKKEPTEELAPMEVVTEEAAPTGRPLEGPIHLLVTVDDATEELTALQVQHGEKTKVETPHSGFPSWTKLLHPPWLATTVGQIPPTPSELK